MGHQPEIQVITTKGDVVQDRFDKIEGKGFFTKELEDALLSAEIDMAVHSLKDLPTQSPTGLCISAIPKREDARDLLISRLPVGDPLLVNARIGTSSLRRVHSLKELCRDCEFEPIRGNVPTRLRKLREGQVDALMLAAAGVKRLALDLTDLHATYLPVDQCVPAPGQGALAIQCREDFEADLNALMHQPTADCVNAERWVLAALEGGCQLPLGLHIRAQNGQHQLNLFLADVSRERKPISLSLVGADPTALAREAFQEIRTKWLR